MKLLLILVSLTMGSVAVIETVDFMHKAAAVMENAATLSAH